MQSNQIVIDIWAPVERVFRFCINPVNTPRWIPFVLEERSSTSPVGVGTIFSQRIKSDHKVKFSQIVVTGFVENERLDFHGVNSAYACYYRFEAIPSGTRLTYVEEAGLDEKLDVLPHSCFESLKRLLEQS